MNSSKHGVPSATQVQDLANIKADVLLYCIELFLEAVNPMIQEKHTFCLLFGYTAPDRTCLNVAELCHTFTPLLLLLLHLFFFK